jgi:hypothetical protein
MLASWRSGQGHTPQRVKTFTANACIRAGTGHSGARDQLAGVDPEQTLGISSTDFA